MKTGVSRYADKCVQAGEQFARIVVPEVRRVAAIGGEDQIETGLASRHPVVQHEAVTAVDQASVPARVDRE